MKTLLRCARIILVLLVGLTIMLPGYGKGAGAAQKVVLKFWHPDTREDNIKARTLVMDDFRAQHPDVSFDVTTIDWDLLYPKLQAMVAAGTPPDVYFLDQPALVYGAALDNLLVPLTSMIKKIGEDSWPRSMLNAVTVNEQIWGFPLHSVPQLIWYRKDLFQQAGLQPPTTLENLLVAAQKLNNPPKMYGIALKNDAPDPEIVIEVLASFGSSLFNDRGDITINVPETVRALDYLKKLWRTGSPDAISKSDLDSRLVFDVGGAAIIMTTVSQLTDFTKPQTKIKFSQVGTVPIPNMMHKFPVNPAKFTSLAIPRGAKNVEVAQQFLEFWATYAESLKFAQTTVIGHIPVIKAVFAPNSPYWTTPRIAPFAEVLRMAAESNAKEGFIPGMYPKLNSCGPRVLAGGIYTQMISHLVADGWNSTRVASWAQDEAKRVCGK